MVREGYAPVTYTNPQVKLKLWNSHVTTIILPAAENHERTVGVIKNIPWILDLCCRLEHRTFSTAEFLSGHPDLQPFTFHLFQSLWDTSVHTVFMEDLGMYCSDCSMGVMLCCTQYTQSQCMEWRER